VTTPVATERTPTPSLRRRVTLTVLTVIAVLLLVVGITIDLALGVQLRRDVHDRLLATAPSRAGVSPHSW
jgi:two-component system OmpR family sensor kinase